MKSPKEIQTYEKQKEHEVIKDLKKRKLSIRQIERSALGLYEIYNGNAEE